MTSASDNKHRDWVVKELTVHTEQLKNIRLELKHINENFKLLNGRMLETEKQVATQKGAGIFVSCLFTVILIVIAVIQI